MRPVLAIVGPTASGKTRMGVEVALELRAAGRAVEIVSCDSMGVYRRLDIAADKPPPAERRGVPHHLFDLAEPDEAFTAVRFRAAARSVVDGLHARGGVPLVVGGSGLWFRALVDDLPFAPTDPEVRSRLAAEDPADLYRRLQAVDPDAARRIDPRNVRRVVRAVEIHELTGRPPSELRRGWDSYASVYDLDVVGLTWPRETLFARAAERVDRELEAGLLDEVAGVLPAGISRTARQALGVKEMLLHLEDGVPLEQARAVLVRNTKNFVRRQLSWFRADPRVAWIDVGALGWEAARSAIAERFAASLRA